LQKFDIDTLYYRSIRYIYRISIPQIFWNSQTLQYHWSIWYHQPIRYLQYCQSFE